MKLTFKNFEEEIYPLNIVGMLLDKDITWGNLIESMIQIIKEYKAKIIVLPEHALEIIRDNSLLSGKHISIDEMLYIFVNLSLEEQITIIPGTYKRNCRVICPVISKGIQLGAVQKRNVPTEWMQEIEIFNIEGLRTGILICLDIERTQIQQQILKTKENTKLDLIINPAMIQMKHNAATQYLGTKAFKIARHIMSANIYSFISALGCLLFRVDWAEHLGNGIIGTSLSISWAQDIFVANQGDPFISMTL